MHGCLLWQEVKANDGAPKSMLEETVFEQMSWTKCLIDSRLVCEARIGTCKVRHKGYSFEIRASLASAERQEVKGFTD